MKWWSSSGPILGRRLALSLNAAIFSTEYFMKFFKGCIGPNEAGNLLPIFPNSASSFAIFFGSKRLAGVVFLVHSFSAFASAIL